MSSTFWLPGETQRLGDEIVAALDDQRWSEAVLAAHALIEHEARRWAEAEGGQSSEGLAAFLFLRGVPAIRYRNYLQSLIAARAGRSVTRAAALSVFVMALEVIW